MNAADLEAMRAEHEGVFGEAACPEWARDSLERYAEHGIPTGDCLRAVLANDLREAFGRADISTARRMAAIVAYVYNKIPRSATGSYRAVDEGIREKAEERARERARVEP